MIKPFTDDVQEFAIGDLTIENGTTAVVISGQLEITRDKRGLQRARALKQLADALVAGLEAGDLPDQLQGTSGSGPDGKPTCDQVPNPFA